MVRPVVSLVKFTDPYNTIREALELCGGLNSFRPDDKILIKPNLVGWDFDLPFPPYGMVTTSAVIFALVRILAEQGFKKITIGEGPLMIPHTIGHAMYNVLGYEKLKERYGVKLVDFNEDKFLAVNYEDFKFSISRKAFKADKIINVPVLKTHSQGKVSLGIKNLKGCLNRRSKTISRGKDANLDHIFPLVAEQLTVALTIIDGIYTLNRGPSFTGKSYRKDVVLASTDLLACDVAGAEIMGYSARDVEHISYFAGRQGRSPDLKDIELVGEEIEKHRRFVDYDWKWTPEDTMPLAFAKRGMTGLAVRKYDSSLCAGCSTLYNPMLILLMSSFRGEPFPNLEIVSGKRQYASSGFDKTILFGKCACAVNKGNPAIKRAVELKSCPPSAEEIITKFKEEGIDCNIEAYMAFRHHLFNRYKLEDGFKMDFYKEQAL
ncbi:MAG: hypothetical protein JL50_04700 [Peptococcaceae bacterium BICA1-7]|nr:MAG: hypothetical protein JL50_04700 [Peptococcaceae bacterium BICA1-7]HBV95922.1 DUF362 domain-containing protein [Desulfotomaculum sp.]